MADRLERSQQERTRPEGPPSSSTSYGTTSLDERPYPKQIAVTDQQLAAVNLHGDPFHPEWNYTIKPRS